MTEIINSIATSAGTASANGQFDSDSDHVSALRFITCGSVDDGKSTLIGRLLVDTRAVLQDQLAGVTKSGETDLALLTDGLSAEREQGITIDVAYRYFNTDARKFIIGDAPGHEQYTRNMVTAVSSADAAVVLVDATKLDWQNPGLQLLPQTRRHSLLAHLLRVHSLVFAVNKLDAVADPALAFTHIRGALARFAQDAGIAVAATVPVSALKGYNVVNALAFPVQWVEKFHDSAVTTQGRRVFWGRVAAGSAQVGAQVQILPSGQLATIAQVIDHARAPQGVTAGLSAGITLDREVDVSRGDWIVAAPVQAAVADDDFDTPTAQPAWPSSRSLSATVAWMDNEPLVPGRVYWALHGHRWVKAKAQRVVHRLNVNTLAEEDAAQLEPNAIGVVEFALQEAIPSAAFHRSRALGSLILVDTASNATAAAVLVR